MFWGCGVGDWIWKGIYDEVNFIMKKVVKVGCECCMWVIGK